MKGFTLVAVIFGSILGGAVGGYGAAQLAPAKPDTARKAASVVTGESSEDYLAKIEDQNRTIKALDSKLADLNTRLDKSDKAKQDAAALDKKVDELGATVAKVKERVENQPAATPGSEGVHAGGAVTQDDFDRMAEAREKRKEEERQAAREKEMADRMAKRNASIVDNMDKKLQLTTAQKDKLTKLLEAQNARFAELGKKGQEAREKGEQFDWRQEMQTLQNETLTLVRNELTPAQQQTFDEATKDSGMRAFEPQGGGFGGPGMGGQGGPGGRRGGGN